MDPWLNCTRLKSTVLSTDRERTLPNLPRKAWISLLPSADGDVFICVRTLCVKGLLSVGEEIVGEMETEGSGRPVVKSRKGQQGERRQLGGMEGGA